MLTQLSRPALWRTAKHAVGELLEAAQSANTIEDYVRRRAYHPSLFPECRRCLISRTYCDTCISAEHLGKWFYWAPSYMSTKRVYLAPWFGGVTDGMPSVA
ncbi:hypothetical protein PtrSN002B_012202, partial [Pyrenophora tritici-repentis]